jgi:hypothetical protein
LQDTATTVKSNELEEGTKQSTTKTVNTTTNTTEDRTCLSPPQVKKTITTKTAAMSTNFGSPLRIFASAQSEGAKKGECFECLAVNFSSTNVLPFCLLLRSE